MRTIFLAWLLGCLLAATWAAPALAGGGHGGVCAEAPPPMDAGWVAVGDNCFSPVILSIDAGQTLRWQLVGYPDAHTVSIPAGPDSGPLPSGETFGVTFNTPGRYTYSCIFHPGMSGTVEVIGTKVAGPAMQTVSQSGVPIEDFELAGGLEAGALEPASKEMVIAFDPLAAAVLLILVGPVSFAASFRLVRPRG
jgi:plastocyanin